MTRSSTGAGRAPGTTRRVLRPQPTVILSPTEPAQTRSRLHLDVNATDRDQDAELDRILALGARPTDVGQGDDVSWHVLADPEGNEFCLLRTRLG